MDAETDCVIHCCMLLGMGNSMCAEAPGKLVNSLSSRPCEIAVSAAGLLLLLRSTNTMGDNSGSPPV